MTAVLTSRTMTLISWSSVMGDIVQILDVGDGGRLERGAPARTRAW